MEVLETDNDRFSMLLQVINLAGFADTLKNGEAIFHFNCALILTTMLVSGNRIVHFSRSDKHCVLQLIKRCAGRIVFQHQRNEIIIEHAHR
jgi:hypothetical protein